jgi:ribose transport system permease protein
MKSLTRFNLGLDRFSGLYMWALFIVVFGIWTPQLFLSMATLHSVASAQAIGAMVALAALIPIACGNYDLSIGAIVNFTAILVTIFQVNERWNLWTAIIAAAVVGAVIGAVNGFIVVVLRVNSFIATLGTATIITAVQTIITGGSQPLPIVNSTWVNLTQVQVGGFQIVVIYLVVVALFAWWLMDHTPMGRYFYAVGSNREAARLSGVRVGKWSWLSLTLSGAICGIAGIFYASLYGPSLTFGSALLLPAFAAVFLGSTQIRPGKFNVWGTLIAVYALATGVQGLQLVTGVQWLSDMFNGVALIAAVSFAVWRQRHVSAVQRVERDQAASPAEDALEAATLATPQGGASAGDLTVTRGKAGS